MRIFFVICLAFCATHPGQLAAHESAHVRIDLISAELREHPDDAELYLQRGEIYRRHQDWQAAADDFEQVRRLAPDHDLLSLSVAALWLDQGDAAAALPEVDRFLAGHPEHVVGHLLRAEALAQLDQPCLAAVEMGRAIALNPNPLPEQYLQQARWLTEGESPRHDEALQVLDAGVARLGPVASLLLEAVEIDTRRGRYDAALARLDGLDDRTLPACVRLARRGEVLQAADRSLEAQVAYTEALEAIATLPPGRRSTPSISTLSARLHDRLLNLDQRLAQ